MGIEIDLLKNYPKTKRAVKERGDGKGTAVVTEDPICTVVTEDPMWHGSTRVP